MAMQEGIHGRVLVAAGTHGNERNAPWLMELWRQRPGLLACHGLAVELVTGNPAALAAGLRYVERDLNRSFDPALLEDGGNRQLEVERARQLLARYGPAGATACLVAVDLHSTTTAMGNCLVVYGRRPADLALAAALQHELGLPIYLHEADPNQTGYLVERWPCGLVVEVGPVPQGVLDAGICRQTTLALETVLAALAAARRGSLRQPAVLEVHRHLGSLDLPRRDDGTPEAVLHPRRAGRDWRPLRAGEPLFQTGAGETIVYRPPAALENETVSAVFLNEAAYAEKGIALSLTRLERWPVRSDWAEALQRLAAGLEASGSPAPPPLPEERGD